MNQKILFVTLLTVLATASAQASVQCGRAKRDVNLNGVTYSQRIVNISQDGKVVYSENFDVNEAYRNQAADACKLALESTRECQTREIPAQEAATVSSRYKQEKFAASPARQEVYRLVPNLFGYKVAQRSFASMEACLIDVASDAIDEVKDAYLQEQGAENAKRAEELRQGNYGSKL